MEAPFVHYQCECGRQFIGEEMYLCMKCNKTMCRFCLHEDEIREYYCRHCLEQVNSFDAQNQNNNCIKHLKCPICFQVLIISLSG